MDRPEGNDNDNEKDSGKACPWCDQGIALPYWCETCERLVPEKRCLGCGLKARKVRRPVNKTSST
jgi:Zn ribbon nucleic-acid-binding protein